MVALTALGRQLAEQAFREDMLLEAGLLSSLSVQELEMLGGLLGKLSDAVQRQLQDSAAHGG